MEELGHHSREGLGRIKDRRSSLVVLLAVSLMMILSSLYGAQASVFEKARETLLDIAEPVLTFFGTPIRFVDNRLGDITDYFNVLEQNKRLREENAELRVWVNEALTLRQQVNYFQKIFDVRMVDQARYIDAQVIGETGGPYQRSLILNSGRRDGVENGDAVVDSEGLIGHIITTGGSASRVLLLTDFSSRTPVFIEGANLEAILAGQYLEKPELKFLSSRDLSEVTEGMRIITSGAGGRLPRGLPVGVVETLTEEAVKVRLYTTYHETDFVRVVDYEFTDASPDEVAPADTALEEVAAEGADG